MFGVSPAELLTIAVVALVVFGPKRLPEMSRKAGKALKELKAVADDLRRNIEAETGALESDLGEVRRGLGPTLGAAGHNPSSPPAVNQPADAAPDGGAEAGTG